MIILILLMSLVIMRITTPGIRIPYRAPDNFLKQGVADASLEAKGVFLQNAEVFSLPSFTQVRFYKLQI